jgi:PAS domain S-box-containing protein
MVYFFCKGVVETVAAKLNFLQSSVLTGEETPEKALQAFLNYLVEQTGSQGGFVYQAACRAPHETSFESLLAVAPASETDPVGQGEAGLLHELKFFCLPSLLDQVASTRQAVLVNGLPLLARTPCQPADNVHCLVIPLVWKDKLVGALGIVSNRQPYAETLPEALLPLGPACAALAIAQKRQGSIQNNDLFQLLIKNSSDLITVLDADGCIRYESPSFYRAFGYREEQVIGHNVFSFLHPEDIEKVAQAFQATLSNPGFNPPVEFRFLDARGKYVHLEAIGNNLLADASIRGIVVNSRDITERMQTATDLLNSKAHIRALLETSPQAYLLLDKDYTVLKCNEVACQLVGRFTGMPVVESQPLPVLTPFLDQGAFAAAFARALAGDQIAFEHQVRVDNATGIWLEIQLLPVISSRGEVYAVSFSALDITQRKKSEMELEKLSLVARHTDNAVIITDRAGMIEWVNEGFCRVTGYSPEEAVGKKPGTLLQGPLSAPDKIVKMSACLENGQGFKEEIINYHKNGTPYWAAMSVSPVVDRAGQVSNFIAIESDITSRKQLEEKLLLTQHSVLNASEGILWVDKNARIRAVNKACCKLLGYPEEGLLLKSIADIDPDFANVRWQEHWGQLQQHQSVTLEGRLKAKDGRIIIVEINANHLSAEEEYNVAFLRDITERKRLEEITRQHLAILHAVQESTDNLIFALDRDYRYLSFNARHAGAIYEMCGVRILPAMSAMTNLERGRSGQRYKTYLDRALNGEHFKVEEVKTTLHGKRYYEVSFHPIQVEGEQSTGVAVFAQDITGRKQAEAERQQLIDDLLRQNQDLEQFAFITSHNLRAPVANLLGLLHLYNRPDPSDPENEFIMESLQQTVARLDEVIRDLNELLSVRTKVQEARTEVFFAPLTRALQESIRTQLEESGATLETDFSGAASVYSLRSYLQSILLNLLTNAIKYRSPDRRLRVRIETQQEGAYVKLTVSDNGMGIDLTRNKDKIFGLYRRFHSHTEGKGLGLHLVKTQAEALGGKVSVASQEGIGSSFTVYIKKHDANSNQPGGSH